MTLRRGFRAQAERTSHALRAELGLQPHDPIQLRELAEHRGVGVVLADDLVDLKRLQELDRLQPFAFSACTFEIRDQPVIVLNPLRSPARQNSDLGHELSHMILNHELSEVHEIAGVEFRTCRADQEEEATNLAGTLLLPRALLIRAVAQGWTADDIASSFGVSLEMARFRVNTTGVQHQVRAAAASRRARG